MLSFIATFVFLFVVFGLLPIAVLIASPLLLVWAFYQSHWLKEWKMKRYTAALYEKARTVANVPPPPPVVNNIAGARYRDILIEAMSGDPPDNPLPINRFEHVHMVAQIGHGKTQAMQNFIFQDTLKLGDLSVIVIDSQGEMIKNILNLPIPKENIVYINPRDTEFPPALNLFDATHSDKEANATIEIYEYIMGGIFGAELTSKQGVAFRFVIRLMLLIPNATIDTLLQVFQDHTKFQAHVDQLSSPARSFFDNEFGGGQFRDTRQQVVRRIFTVMENQVLYRMFSAERSRLDLAHEMSCGKLILIDTAKDVLKEEGARIMGRFFIAKIVQAAQERGHDKHPTHVYIDEAQDYFDEKTEIFLSQRRKQKVGGFFAHQYLGQLPQKLQEAFMANTATKLVGGVSMKDARSFAPDMRVTPKWIASQPKGTFATKSRQMPQAIALDIPFFVMEKSPHRTDMEELISYQRQQYASVAAQPEIRDESPSKQQSDDIDQPSYEP